jgi:glycosyltransferase involved in cell wall biosynthesis
MAQMIKDIAIFHQTLRRQGGMEHYAIILARNFRKLGLRVTFYARRADERLASELGVEVRHSPQWRGFRRLGDWQFQKFIERSAPCVEGLQIALSRVAARHLVVCGGTHVGYLKAARKIRGPFDLLQLRLEKRAYATAQFVISHSDLCTGELQTHYGLEAEKIKTLYPPVERRFAPGNCIASRRCLGLPTDKPVLLFPSMGHGRKGLKQLCAALAEMDREVVLAVAGKPAGASRWPFVHSLGYVDNMERAYQAADFTVLASSYEPFGLVGPESVLCGTRLVFEEQIGCLSAIDQRAVTLFNARDKSSVKAAIEEVLRLRRSGAHRIDSPRECLRYDANPLEHCRTILRLGERAMNGEPETT